MAVPIRAIYEDGKLLPLEPLNLKDGQEVTFMFLSDREIIIAALGDLFMPVPPGNESHEIDEEALFKEIDRTYHGPPVSDVILEERREGL